MLDGPSLSQDNIETAAARPGPITRPALTSETSTPWYALGDWPTSHPQ